MLDLRNITRGPATTALGGVAGVALIEDGLREAVQDPGNWFAWVRLLIGVVSVVVGGLMGDPAKAPPTYHPGARPGAPGGFGRIDSLALLASVAVFGATLTLLAMVALGAPRINTELVALTINVARTIGNAQGRGLLTIRNMDTTNTVACGPVDLPQSEWVELAAKGSLGDSVQFGILYRGQFTAQAVIQCINTAASANVAYVEEGDIPQVTPTP